MGCQRPAFCGWEIYHLKGSAAEPDRIYSSQTGGWFGQVIQRSDDGGQTWETVGNEFKYDGALGTHKWYDGTQHPWEFKRIWHLEPSLTDPDTVYAGAEDAALFKTVDGGRNWQEISHAGVYNLTSMYATEELWFTDWEFKGTPWDNPELYAKWSPHLSAKNFKTPTLVVHGELDYRVPVGEGLQLFSTLQRKASRRSCSTTRTRDTGF